MNGKKEARDRKTNSRKQPVTRKILTQSNWNPWWDMLTWHQKNLIRKYFCNIRAQRRDIKAGKRWGELPEEDETGACRVQRKSWMRKQNHCKNEDHIESTTYESHWWKYSKGCEGNKANTVKMSKNF